MDEPENRLDPLPYQVELRDYLKTSEPELWRWFSSAQAKADYTERLRADLLKHTYRLDREAHPALYDSVDEAKTRLQLDIPITLYQAQHGPDLNAALHHLPGEAHIVFWGPVFTLLSPAEIQSVIGHELAHYHLWERDGGDYLIADRLLHAVADDPRSATSHEQTARRFRLYTEVFADRGALRVSQDLNPVVSGLVKMQTGLAQVSAVSYLKQAAEIFGNGNVATEGVSHPEAFIRAQALLLWQQDSGKAEEPIRAMIEGLPALDELDLPGQRRLAAETQRMLGQLLRPRWFQTPAVLGHARLFFNDFKPAHAEPDGTATVAITGDEKVREYLCYVLLDFSRVDPDLDEMPLAAALEMSRRMEIDGPFERLAVRELKLKPRELKRLKEQATQMLIKAEVGGE